jgi:hypothetical protein
MNIAYNDFEFVDIEEHVSWVRCCEPTAMTSQSLFTTPSQLFKQGGECYSVILTMPTLYFSRSNTYTHYTG